MQNCYLGCKNTDIIGSKRVTMTKKNQEVLIVWLINQYF